VETCQYGSTTYTGCEVALDNTHDYVGDVRAAETAVGNDREEHVLLLREGSGLEVSSSSVKKPKVDSRAVAAGLGVTRDGTHVEEGPASREELEGLRHGVREDLDDTGTESDRWVPRREEGVETRADDGEEDSDEPDAECADGYRRVVRVGDDGAHLGVRGVVNQRCLDLDLLDERE
jgi:hypothetical protein